MKTFVCIKCRFTLPFATVAKDAPFKCSHCGNIQYTAIYPAMFAEAEKGNEPEKVLLDEHASCFFHQDKVATVPCDECGVFLCNLCDISLEGQHHCSKCFKGHKKKVPTMQARTVLYDDIMLGLALLPILFIYITILTAPIVIAGSIFFWNKVNTPYERGKWRFVLAILIAFVELAGWAIVLIAIFSS